MAGKIDFKKTYRSLYGPGRTPATVDVPQFQYLMIHGRGAPEDDSFKTATNALYLAAYSLKFLLKKAGRLDYVVPPLEALRWAGDPAAFEEDRREEWQWTVMLMQPAEATSGDLSAAIEGLEKKGKALSLPWPDDTFEPRRGTLRAGSARRAVQRGQLHDPGPARICRLAGNPAGGQASRDLPIRSATHSSGASEDRNPRASS